MPRAKVKPQDRQRSVIACLPCKQSKIRCDAGAPCSTCLRRGKESGCVYQQSTTARARRQSRVSSISKADHDRPLTELGTFDDEPPTLAEEGSLSNGSNEEAFSTDESQAPRSRMLLSSRLEKVYIGETASLSYLQFLRHIVKHRVGPCTFTEGEFNNYMLELESSDGPTDVDVVDGIDQAAKTELAQWYLDATSGILNLFTKDEILRSLVDPRAVDSPLDLATTYLILAIGAQCRGNAPGDAFYSNNLFSQARKMAFETMLHDPSPRMVRQFLLMAFYMLGACHRNAAFMYLGVASRAATTLGMHRVEHYVELPAEETRGGTSTWKSLRALDMIVNSILGRTGTLAGIQDSRLPSTFESWSTDGSPRELGLHAIFALCPFMEELERKGPKQPATSTENFLQRLQQWSKGLPEEVKTSTDLSPAAIISHDKERFIAGTHVACVYYFSIILTTRRFLTLHLLPRTRQRRQSQNSDEATNDRNTSLAHVCLNAAVNLAKVGHNALKSEQMPNNMCLMKAWMFASGLLLGYWLFANGADAEVEEAFEQARAVEKKIAILSPQAGHYYDILSAFSEAIVLHQRQVTDERKRATSRYMDQIFTVNETASGAAPGFEAGIPLNNSSGLGTSDPLDNTDFAVVDQEDSYGLSLPDEPSWLTEPWGIDLQPFTSFFDDVLYP